MGKLSRPRLHTVVIRLSTVAVLVAGCSASPQEDGPAPHAASLPSFSIPSREDVIGMLQEGKNPPPINVSAAVFDVDQSIPKTDQPEWQALVSTLASARDEVTRNSFVIQVVGYADSTGSVEHNVCLSKARAEATRQKIIDDAGYPAAAVAAFAGGVDGDTASARRVQVTIVKAFDAVPCSTSPNPGAGVPCC
jgi:hypothetical protein